MARPKLFSSRARAAPPSVQPCARPECARGADARRQSFRPGNRRTAPARRWMRQSLSPSASSARQIGIARAVRSAGRLPPPVRAASPVASVNAAPIEPPESRASDARSAALGSGRCIGKRVFHAPFRPAAADPAAGSASGWWAKAGPACWTAAAAWRRDGGSSSILSSALAALSFMSSAVSTMATRQPPAPDVMPKKSASLRISSDRQHRHQLAGLGIDAALEHQKSRMRPAADLDRVWIIGRHRKVFRRRYRSRHRPADSGRCDRPGSPCRCRAGRRSARRWRRPAAADSAGGAAQRHLLAHQTLRSRGDAETLDRSLSSGSDARALGHDLS